MRLNAAGSALEYGTFLGGSSNERGLAVALDAAGRTTVTGHTDSDDFPITPGAFDPSYAGGSYYGDAFVVRLNAAANALDYATFLGGNDSDMGTVVGLDAAGQATVTGWTQSGDFPITPNAYDPSYNGGYGDTFVVRLNAEGSALVHSTFLGGSGDDWAFGLVLDATGRTIVTGITNSNDFPTAPGAFDPSFNGGDYDAFVARLNAAGSALDYGTFLGGSDWDEGYALALDAAGRTIVAGFTESSNFPTTRGAFDPSYNGGGQDAFASKLNLAPPCTLPWDIVPDGVVDVADITAIAIEWGQPAPPGYDFDGDGIVTIVDIQTVVAHWGSSCSGQARPVNLPLIRK